MAKKDNNSKSESFEKTLFKAADKLRKNMDAAEYKHIVLGLIFLKYISDSFEALHMNINDLKIRDFFLIFGTSLGKDIRYALTTIFPKAREVVLVKADNPRALMPVEIYRRARRYQHNMTIAPSVTQAIKYFKSKSPGNTIIITGSFYLWQPDW